MGEAASKRGNDVDVAVLGGGIAGLTLAYQLVRERPRTRIAVLEKGGYPAPESAYKVGESVAEVAAIYLKTHLELGDYLLSEHLRKMGLRWFCSANGNDDITSRVEFGLRQYSPLYNFHLDRGKIENHLVDLVSDLGVQVHERSPVTHVELASDGHVVTIGRDTGAREIRARWVIDATGRAAFLRRQLRLGVDLPIDAAASWFRIPQRICIDEWSDDEAWRAQVPTGTRWKSTISFVGEGYWTWVINLGSGTCSVGVVGDPRYVPFERIRRYDAVLEWLRENEPQLAERLPESEEGILDFHKRKDFSATSSRAFSRKRWGLTGEGAAFLDPLYSTGLDFTAIANTLATDLIVHDLEGAPASEMSERTRSHNRSFLGIAALGLPMFRGQLAIYRDPQATGAKFLWDNATYFSILLNVFKNGALTEPAFVKSIQPSLKLTLEMLEFMEMRIREWSSSEWDTVEAGIPIGSDTLWNNLFHTPGRDLDRAELREHVELSLRRLRTMSDELCGRFCEAAGEPLPQASFEMPEPLDEQLIVWSPFEPGSRGPSLEQGQTSWHSHAPLASAATA